MSEKPPWHAWYKTARWQRARQAIFLRDGFQCRMCGRVEGDTSKLVCDHINPHRGDARHFWPESNLQTLCQTCHSSAKQAQEQTTLQTRGVWY